MSIDFKKIASRILSVRLGSLMEEAEQNWEAVSQGLPEDIMPIELEKILSQNANANTNFLTQIRESPSLFGEEKIIEKAISQSFPKIDEGDLLINVGDRGKAGTYYLFEGKSIDDVKSILDSAVVGNVMVSFDLNSAAYNFSSDYDFQ